MFLQNKLHHTEQKIFSLDNLQSDENIAFYTGFPNYRTFLAIFKFMNTGAKGYNVRYHTSKKNDVEADFYQSQVNEDNIEDQDDETPKRNVADQGD